MSEKVKEINKFLDGVIVDNLISSLSKGMENLKGVDVEYLKRISALANARDVEGLQKLISEIELKIKNGSGKS